MDATLARFLGWVRPRAREPHLVAYEDVAVALDGFLRRRRRTSTRLRPIEIRTFLGYWYLRHRELLGAVSARRFCAASRVFVHWLGRDASPKQADRLRLEATRAARDTTRAARASDLLERHTCPRAGRRAGLLRDGYWQVLLLGSSHAVLRALGDSRGVGPVLLPEEVVRMLRPGSILNLRIEREETHWRVVVPGPCYPALALPALCDAVVPHPA